MKVAKRLVKNGGGQSVMESHPRASFLTGAKTRTDVLCDAHLTVAVLPTPQQLRKQGIERKSTKYILQQKLNKNKHKSLKLLKTRFIAYVIRNCTD